MLTTEEIKNFCFDVLGDFIDPKTDIMIQEVRGSFRVMVIRTRGIPKEVIRDEWNRNAQGSDFEQVSLYL